MAQTIKLKRSSVAGKVPTNSDLEYGEIGINTADGKIYLKKSGGGAQVISAGFSGDYGDLTNTPFTFNNITGVSTNADLGVVFHTGGTALQTDAGASFSFNPSTNVLKVAGSNVLTTATLPAYPSVGNGTLTINTAGSASGSGTFTANQSGNSTITITGATIPSSLPASGGNADTVDGFHAATHGANIVIRTHSNGYLQPENWIKPANGTGLFYQAGVHFYETSNKMYSSTSLISANQGTLWGSSNDGSQSGLDADLLDGVQGSGYARLGGTDHLRSIPNRWFATADADNNIDYYQHNYAKAHLGNTYKYTTSRPAITSDSNYWVGSMGWGAVNLNTIFSYGSGFWDAWSMTDALNRPSNYTTHWNGINSLHYSASTTSQYGMQMAMGVGDPSHTYLRGQWGAGVRAWQKIWTTGNDGQNSGLDADLLDGLDLHSGRNNEANKVVRTNSSGYADFGWINTTSGQTTSTLNRIYASDDGYIRYYTPANFGSQIAPHIPHNDSSSVLQTKTLKVLATNIGNLYGGHYTIHTATNKNIIVEEMTVFMDVTGSGTRPVFSTSGSDDPKGAGGIRASVLSEWGSGSYDRDAVCSVKSLELNAPHATNGIKTLTVATSRDPVSNDSDASRQIIPISGSSTVKLQINCQNPISTNATGSWYIYIQVKFREVDVQADYRNATLVATV